MAHIFRIHQENPQARLIAQTVDLLRNGGLIVIPTDCAYVLACSIHEKSAMERLRQIRGIDDRHLLTLLCHDLSNIGLYAKVDNSQYRFLKAATPGPYTFILEATKELPRRVISPKRKTIGVRIPDHLTTLSLLAHMNEPLITSSMIPAGQTEPMTDAEDILMVLDSRIDAVIESGYMTTDVTTVLDLTEPVYRLIRQGKGAVDHLSLKDA